jgi:thioester reductase-like protein
MIYACLQLGYWPDIEMKWEIAPVDYISQGIVYLSQQPTSFGERFQLTSSYGISINQFFKWVVFLGYQIRPLALDKWQDLLVEQAASSQDKILISLSPFFAKRSMSENRSMTAKIEAQQTIDRLAKGSIVCPPLDEQILRRYFSYFVKCGFIISPEAAE